MYTWVKNLIPETLIHIKPLSGGDTSKVFKIEAKNKSYLLKTNQLYPTDDLFSSEAIGLEAIRKSNTINVPKVFKVGTKDNLSYLLLEYIPSKPPNAKSFKKLGHKLALLHKHTSVTKFGFDSNNFIGSLPQRNCWSKDWSTFYLTQRLIPQFKLAVENKLWDKHKIPSETISHKQLNALIGDVTPSLLHGDLWNGNYLMHANGTPYLIDPSIHYGHNEVDLAMTKLFGGFDNSFYEAYYEVVAPHENKNALTEVYQLYYLLVHLNLFGKSYFDSANTIVKRYFN